MKKLGTLTSGGDSPGMNAAVRAVVRTAASRGIDVIGFEDGYRGLLENRGRQLAARDVSDILDRGGTFLGSGRSDEFATPEGVQRAVTVCQERGLDGLVVIGGDGSLRGAHELETQGIPSVGVPGSIDNDLAGTDYCIGFDTALNNVISDVAKIRDTASAMDRVFVVEVMGRASGALAVHAGVACGADALVIPEVPADYDRLARDIVADEQRQKHHFIVIVAEGAAKAEDVAAKIGETTGHEARVSVLGYVQRGGSPSGLDRVLASRLGAAAVELLVSGDSDVMVGVLGEDVVTVPLQEATGSRPEIDAKLYELVATLAT